MNSEITVREAIELTGYSRQQIYNLIVQNQVKARQPGHEYFIDLRSLLNYVESRKQSASVGELKQ